MTLIGGTIDIYGCATASSECLTRLDPYCMQLSMPSIEYQWLNARQVWCRRCGLCQYLPILIPLNLVFPQRTCIVLQAPGNLIDDARKKESKLLLSPSTPELNTKYNLLNCCVNQPQLPLKCFKYATIWFKSSSHPPGYVLWYGDAAVACSVKRVK